MSEAARHSTGRKLFRSTLTVGSMTMVSRVAGLVRDMVIAAMFGATANADAFFVAFRIPQFLRRLFAEGAFSQAFVPVLSEYQTTRSVAEVKALVDAVSGVLGAALLAVTALAVVGAPVVTLVFAPGFLEMPEKMALTTEMIRITFPYLFFISLTGFTGAVLNSYSRFAVPAFTPVFLNLTLIAGAVYGAHYFDEPALALAWSVFIAGLIQFFFQLPFVARIGMLPRPRFLPKHDGVRRILALMIPALFGVSVSQINLMLDTVLASFLPTGSVSWLYYAERLSELPLGVFGIAIATVILPGLSREFATDSDTEYRHTLDWAVAMICMVSFPSAAALLLLGEPILVTLFQYGEMNARDAAMTSLSLGALALGLPAFMLIKIFASAWYARQDTRTPVRIGIIAMVANMGLNLLFVIPLHHFFKIGHMGLALATTGAAYLNAGLLFHGLWRKGIYGMDATLRSDLAKILMATLALVVALLAAEPWLSDLGSFAWTVRAWRVGIVCCGGAALYFAVLLATRPAFLARGIRPRAATG